MTVSFRVFPESKQPYWFEVLVFSTTGALSKHLSSRHKISRGERFRGITILDGVDTDRKLGEICFHRRCLSSHLIAHEALHAAISYSQRAKGVEAIHFTQEGWVDRHEERLASIMEKIVKSINRQIENKCSKEKAK